jgi:hypothetical protein
MVVFTQSPKHDHATTIPNSPPRPAPVPRPAPPPTAAASTDAVTQVNPPANPIPPAQVMAHYADPVQAAPAVGPNGKAFERQNQAGASYGPGYAPTEAQRRHMSGGLTDARLTDMDENFAGGINDISRVQYDNGFEGVFKAEADENHVQKAIDAGIPATDPRWGNREVAAFALDRAMGLGMVPQTEFAEHGGQFGTVQQFVEGDTPAKIREQDPERWEKLQNDPRFQSQRADLQAFDYITGNMDRHTNNLIIQTGPDGELQQIHAIDNGISFAPQENLPVDGTHMHGLPEQYNRAMVAKIEALTPELMRKQLEGLLSPDEIDAAIQRRNDLLADVKAKGDDAFVDDWTAEVARRAAAAGAAAQADPGADASPDSRTIDEAARTIDDGATDRDADPAATQKGNPLAKTLGAVQGLAAPKGSLPDDATTRKMS